MTLYNYRWATGHNVPLASLVNVETDLAPFLVNAGAPRRIAPMSQPLDVFPILRRALDGTVKGEGTLTHVWMFDVLPMTALDYILDTYLTTSGSLVASKAITINTRRHDRDTYVRCNAYLVYPKPGIDYRQSSRRAVELKLTFTGVEIL